MARWLGTADIQTAQILQDGLRSSQHGPEAIAAMKELLRSPSEPVPPVFLRTLAALDKAIKEPQNALAEVVDQKQGAAKAISIKTLLDSMSAERNLPLAGGSDGAVFNPATMEAFSTHGNGTLTVVKEKSPMSFEVEQNLDTMNGARTLTLDGQTNHILTMSQERGPAPAPPPGGGRGGFAPPIPGSFTIVMVGK